ncbi:MAG TPA: class I SAM-dependent methyltransferase, partial [Flavobacteriales bacterium]|nr:class I SAM-dependent methyltransferase [Flavobacteriales bacterium]
MKDNFFSPIAANYARFRPSYPPELFAYLASIAPGRSLAWDCATGSGQAAVDLATHFDHVEATDISAELLAQAPRNARITYRQADALDSGITTHSVDLVTVANAMHWFHGEAFEREVRRVLRPGGIIAAWSFAYSNITPEVNRLTRRVHDEIVDPFWIQPNRIVEQGYVDLHFGFDAVQPPPFSMVSQMDLAGIEGYMRTWSASVK